MTDDSDGPNPWVHPPGEEEWLWSVGARLSVGAPMVRWPAAGPHRAGAKQNLLDALAPETTVVEWGRTEVVG